MQTQPHRQPERASVPLWGVLSATAAPVLLIGGWTLAARLQHGGFDPVADTISALAARGTDDRWVMTAALAGVAAAHVISAMALRPAGGAARLLLAAGGVATAVVAAAPLPAGGGSARVHAVSAGVAFVSLAVWPALNRWRPRLGLAVAVVLVAELGWFFAELVRDGGQVGLTERVAAGSQALWPLVAIVAIRRDPRQLTGIDVRMED